MQTSDASRLIASYAQQRLWFIERLIGGGSAYTCGDVWRLRGPLDFARLRHALDAVVGRHEALRTRFVEHDGELLQCIEASSEWPLRHEDLRALPLSEREAEARRRVQAEATQPFDLTRGPLVRGCVLRLSDDEHWLVLSLHHIVTDGWSAVVLLRELSLLYASHGCSGSSPLPTLPVQYGDYALWQRNWLQGEVLAQQLGHWRAALADLPTLELPTDRVRPAVASYRGGRIPFELGTTLTARLKELSRREAATLFMTLLTVYYALLARYSGQEDIAVGVPIAGRGRPELEGLIGFFVNTLVLRGNLTGNPSFRELLARVREESLRAYAHDLPFAKIVEELAPQRDLSRNPLFQTSFALRPPSSKDLELDGITVDHLQRFPTDSARFDLSFTLEEEAGQLCGTAEYASDLFDRATIERMVCHFTTLLERVVDDPGKPIGELPLLTRAERHQILVEWNATATDYPRKRCIHQLFEQQVKRSPDRVAVVFEEQQLTYAELNTRANQLAHYLRSVGVGPDVPVGVCVERSLELIVVLFGILKAGGAYVPLEPSYPTARLASILEDTDARVVLAGQSLRDVLPLNASMRIYLDAPPPRLRQQPTHDPASVTRPEHLAYILYTSGSTGTPKGVMVEHRALVNHMEWMRTTFGFDGDDSVLQKTPIGFDAATWELFATLLVGGRLIIAPPNTHRDPARIVDAMRKHDVTTLQVVPSLLRMLVDEPGLTACKKLRRVFCGGEALPRAVAGSLLSRCDARLFNLYGPTEACIDSVWSECLRGEGRSTVPIGRPIANTQAYVLDGRRQPVPIGVLGELYLGGDGLARGYLNDPALTAERFIADPFSGRRGARLYRTGDRVRFLADGNLEFFGRVDRQVKLRGFRIELGEIEAVLSEQASVREAIVLLREDVAGEPQLVAYVVPHGAALRVGELRAALRQRLPEPMLPGAFVHLTQLPLTSNGKIDRDALPTPEHRSDESTYSPPRTSIEVAMADVWAEVLNASRVGIDDNFFDLGGHSLLAAQLLNRINRALGCDLTMRDLFAAPTVQGLSLAASARPGKNPAATEFT